MTIRYKIFILLGFIPLLVSWKSTKMNYCGNDQRLSISEILAFDIYKETAYIKLASFLYDENSRSVPLTNGGRVDLNGFLELTKLDDAETKRMMDVLVNYDFAARSTPAVVATDTNLIVDGRWAFFGL
jgi:hypothetical protein